MKKFENLKQEYGKLLRWEGEGEGLTPWPYRFYIEDVETGEHQSVESEEALAFIDAKTPKAFRGDNAYYTLLPVQPCKSGT